MKIFQLWLVNSYLNIIIKKAHLQLKNFKMLFQGAYVYVPMWGGYFKIIQGWMGMRVGVRVWIRDVAKYITWFFNKYLV